MFANRFRGRLVEVLFVVGGFAILSIAPSAVSAQEVCGKEAGANGSFVIRNDLAFDIEVKFVGRDCSERPGITIASGDRLDVKAFENQIIRVYENFTTRVLTDITLHNGTPTITVTGFDKSLDPKAPLCSKDGVAREISLRNASSDAVELRIVDDECKEGDGPFLGSGNQLNGSAKINAVIRAYSRKDGKLVSQIVIRQTVRNYIVGAERSDDPKTGFLNTVNTIRKGKELAPIVLNKTLTSTCQWFVDLMAVQDLGRAGHLVSEFSNDKKYRSYETPEQRLRKFGWKSTKYAETTAMQTTDEYDLIGSHFALEWMSSTTHDKPFFDRDSVKYDLVGFAVAKSKKFPNAYYGCAIFGQSGR